MQSVSRIDVLVGGGPAGSAIAALLARKGWSVTILERDRHPRFHIGESLLPMNMPILERLGVIEQVRAIGMEKLGADFPAARDELGYNVFRFDRSLNPTWPYAFQVRRDEFDQLLFEHAGRCGARTMQNARVLGVEFDSAGVTASIETDGSHRRLRARYFVDATGRDTLLGKLLHLKRRHPSHQSAALFAHFRDVERRAGEDAGNISIIQFAHGWIWIIPLRDGCTSVGAVCWPEYLKQQSGPKEEFLLRTLRSVPCVARRMERAVLVGNLHVTGNYSYICKHMSGKRWLMVGDAFAFLDPIFSTGVYLAMNSAELAAGVVDGTLRAPARERALQRRYERTIRHGLGALSWFIFRFTSPAMNWLFANPRNVLRVKDAMVSMLAGDVFRDGGVRWRLRFFKLLYFVATLWLWKESAESLRRRRRQATAVFSGGTTSQDPA